MTPEQIYSLVNAVTAEALGGTAITVKDVTSFISLGTAVLSTDTNKEKWYQKLADRIGMTYIKYKKYTADIDRGIKKTPIEFGAALQKIQTFELAKAKRNESWDDNPDPFADQKDDTDIVQQIFKGRGIFEIKKVVYDYQLQNAFDSPAAMGNFVNLIFNDMYNAMEVDLENLSKLCRSSAIATCIHNATTAPQVCRNLLSEYKVLNPTSTLTAATCLYDTDFLKFASREINLVVKRMQKMSKLFNSAGADRFTAKSDMVVEVLADFGTATTSYLEADSFHKELVALPMYTEIDNWQGAGEDFAFDEASSINITVGDTEDEAFTVAQDGIIAFVRDADKCGVSFDRIRTKSLYNPLGERTIYAHKADKGWYVDTTENGVVFLVSDVAVI